MKTPRKTIWFTFIYRLIGLLYNIMMMVFFVLYLIPFLLSDRWRTKTLPLFNKEVWKRNIIKDEKRQ